MRRRLAVAGVLLVVVGGFLFALYLPWSAQWGSTTAERAAAMPGDALVPDGRSWTRSITIDAPPAAVWPWLVQIGVDKAGFYTYDWAERLAGDPVHNADRIHPEWQVLRSGDPVRPMPAGEPWRVETVTPPDLLVLSGDRGNWSWTTQLVGLPGERTRVVTRMRSTGRGQLGPFLDAADLIVFPRLLVGLRQRAEGTLPGMPGSHVSGPVSTARLPVPWWAALAWLVGLGVGGASASRVLGLGRFGTARPHPAILGGIGFVAGAGYMIMSDTPPVDLLLTNWLPGSALAVAAGYGLGRLLRPAAPAGRGHPVGRGVQAVSEAGMLTVLPATAVWQAATGPGPAGGPAGRIAVGVAAVAAATAVAGAAWWRVHRWPGVVAAALLAAVFTSTGAALTAIAGAVVAEFVAGRRRQPAGPDGPPVGSLDPGPGVVPGVR